MPPPPPLLSSLLLSLLFASSATDVRAVLASKCDISIKYRKGDLKEPQPLLLTDDQEPSFLMPNSPQRVSIPANANILLACPGRGNSFQNLTSRQSLALECIGGQKFRVNETTLSFDSIACKRLPADAVRRTNTSCLNGRQAFEIGFQLSRTFLPTIQLCRDEETYRTYYARETIAKEIGNHQTGFPRRAWKYDGYFGGYAMNRLYARAQQERTFELLLGKSAASRYVGPRQFLNRGHLAAYGDFAYGVQQGSSLWHLNCLPQWSSFNGGNWRLLEADVRALATKRNSDLVVYTGVHGVLALANEAGEPRDVYLFANETTRAFPVPRFFWKVVQDPASGRATAFVGLNDVFAKEVSDDMYLCPDLGQDKRFSWLNWRPKNFTWGFSYVCAVGDLRKSVPTVPDIGETGLLTD